jgi:hypothetical protein
MKQSDRIISAAEELIECLRAFRRTPAGIPGPYTGLDTEERRQAIERVDEAIAELDLSIDECWGRRRP